MRHFLNILLFLIIIFLPIVSYIIYSQRENKHENDEILKLRINFTSYISILNMFLMSYLSLTFLYVAYISLSINFSIENVLVSVISFIISVLFWIPVFNICNHYLKESRREIYFFRNKKALLIVEKNIETIIDLENNCLNITYLRPKKVVRNPSDYGKYLFILDDKIIEISDLIKFPQDFLDGNNIVQVKVSKLFIWI